MHTLNKTVPIQWNYFATSRGKGVVDGIAGTVKCLVSNAVMTGKSPVVADAQSFYRVASSLTSSVTDSLVSQKEISDTSDLLSLEKCFSEALPLPGISKMHCIEPRKDGSLNCCLYSFQKLIKNRAPDVFPYEPDDDDDDDNDDTISETFCTEAVSSDDDQGEDSDYSSAASCSDEISKKGKHENSEESAGSEGDVEVTNSSKKEVNSNCESGSSTIDVEYGLPPELVTKFSCSVPFTLPPHKTALVAAILDGYVSFNGKGIISPSDLNSLQGGNMVEEDNYLTNFIADTYFEITQAARADGSKVVVFPWEAFEKSAIKLLFTRAEDTLLEQDIILAPCCPITTDHWFLIAVFPQKNLMVALDSLAGDFVKPSVKASMLKMW